MKKNYFNKIFLFLFVVILLIPLCLAHDPTPLFIMVFGYPTIALILSIIFIIILLKKFSRKIKGIKLIGLIVLAIIISAIIAIPLTYGLIYLYAWNYERQYEMVTNPISLDDCEQSQYYDVCVMHYAIKQKNPKICLNIEDEWDREFCYEGYENRIQDKEACKFIKTESIKERCITGEFG